MAQYRYTELDDLQEVIRIAFDKTEATERRIAAIIDLSMVYDEAVVYRLLEMAGDATELPVIRGEVFDQISGRWGERATPVLMQALQDESVEVRFWAAYAAYSTRYQIPNSASAPLVPLLDNVASSDRVYEGWWHEGREALAALETICYRNIAPPFEGDSDMRLISPMPEYVNFQRMQREGKTPPEHSPLIIDPDWLKYHLRQRFYDVKFDVRHPRLSCYQLDWQIGSGKKLLLGALHRDGYGVALGGRYRQTAIPRFARWFRSLIPAKHRLYFYDWADPGLELKHGMSLNEVIQGAD